ncbi:unnamed protein product, partial [Prorocentrum cordatum]
ALFALWRQAAAGGERRRHAQLRGCARATARLRGGLLLGAVVAWQAACAARRAAAVHAVGLRRRRQACEACSLIALSGRALLMLVGAFAWWRRALSAALLARMASRARGLQEARDAAAALLAAERSRALLGAAFAQWRAAEASLEGAGAHKRSSGPRREAGAASRAHVWLAAVLVQWHQAARGRRQEAALRRAGEDGRSRGLREARGFAVDVLVIDRRRSLLGLVWARWRESWHAAKSAAAEAALRGAGEGGRSLGLREARGFAVDVLAIDRRRSLLEVAWATWRVSWHATKSAVAGAALERARAARGTAMSLLATSRCRSWLAAVLARWWQMSQDAAANAAAEAALERARADGRSRGLQEARAWAAGLLAASHTLSRLASVFTHFAIAHGWRQCSRSGTSRPSSPRGPQQQRRQTPGRTSFERQWTSQRAILRPAALVSTWPPCSQSGATRLSCVRRSQQQKQNWLESVQTAGRAGSGTHELVWRACSRPVAIAHGWRQCSRSGTSRPSSPRGPQQQRRQTPGRTSFERHLDVAAGHLTTSRSRFHMAAVFAEWRHASQLGAKVTATEAELARVRADSRSSGLRDARIGAASLLAASCDRSWLAAVLTKWYIASQLTKRTTAAEAADARSHKLREALDVAAGHLTTSRSRFHIAAVFAEWRHASQLGAKVTATEAELARVRADSRSSGLRNARIGAASLLAASCDRSWLAAVLTKWYIASQLTKRTTAAEAADARSHKLREALDVAAGHLTTSRSRFHIAAVFAEWRHAFQAAARSAAYEKALERACADNRSRGFRDGRECAANFLATRLSHYWLATACMEWHRVSQLAATRTAADSLADSFAATRSAALQNAYADGRMHGLREIKDNVARVLANIHSLSWVAAVFAVWCRVSQLASKSAAAEAALRTACAEARSSGLQAARGIAASILATSCDRSWLTSVFVEWCRVSQLATTSAAMGAKLQRAGADGRLRGSIESRERAASLLAATRSRSWLAALLACWFQASRLEALMRWRTRYSQDLALWKQLAGKSQHHNSLLMSFHGWQRATSKAKVDTLRGRSKIMLLDRMISQMQEGLMIVLAEWRRAHAVCALRRSAEVQAEGSARRLAVACRLQAVRGCEWLLGLSCRRPAALAAALLEWRRRATRALLRRTVSAVAARSHRLQLAGLLSEWRGAAAASAERARAREGLRRGLEALGACALRGCSRRRVAAAWAAWQ